MIKKEELKEQWSKIADDWIGSNVSGRDIHRVGLLDAPMLEAIGDVNGKKVIDLGCGEGRFCRMLAKKGAVITGVDSCQQFIHSADNKRVADEEYILGDIEDLNQFEDGFFDLVISYVVLVDLFDFEQSIKEAYNVLKPGGRFIVCKLQSMNTAANSWFRDENNKKLHFKLDNYFDEGPREMPFFGSFVTNFHRMLSSYINCFLKTGFILEGIEEPKPTAEQLAKFPDLDDNMRLPYFIIYLLRKPGVRGRSEQLTVNGEQ